MIQTKAEFDAVCKLIPKIQDLNSRRSSLERDYRERRDSLERDLAAIQKLCPHPFTRRPTAEAEVVCEICGAFV